MATKKPATKKVATTKKTATKKTATKKPAVKKQERKALFQMTANGDNIQMKVEGNGEYLVQCLASAISDEPNLKSLLRMALFVA